MNKPKRLELIFDPEEKTPIAELNVNTGAWIFGEKANGEYLRDDNWRWFALPQTVDAEKLKAFISTRYMKALVNDIVKEEFDYSEEYAELEDIFETLKECGEFDIPGDKFYHPLTHNVLLEEHIQCVGYVEARQYLNNYLGCDLADYGFSAIAEDIEGIAAQILIDAYECNCVVDYRQLVLELTAKQNDLLDEQG